MPLPPEPYTLRRQAQEQLQEAAIEGKETLILGRVDAQMSGTGHMHA
jgi:hypothetical protein